MKEIFTNAIAKFIKRKLVNQKWAATIQDLCTIARRQKIFFERCPTDDWTSDAFIEVSSTLTENLIGAISKLTQQKDQLKQQQTDFSNRNNTLLISNLQNPKTRNKSFNPQ